MTLPAEAEAIVRALAECDAVAITRVADVGGIHLAWCSLCTDIPFADEDPDAATAKVQHKDWCALIRAREWVRRADAEREQVK